MPSLTSFHSNQRIPERGPRSIVTSKKLPVEMTSQRRNLSGHLNGAIPTKRIKDKVTEDCWFCGVRDGAHLGTAVAGGPERVELMRFEIEPENQFVN